MMKEKILNDTMKQLINIWLSLICMFDTYISSTAAFDLSKGSASLIASPNLNKFHLQISGWAS